MKFRLQAGRGGWPASSVPSDRASRLDIVRTEYGTHSLPPSKSGDIVRSPTISSNTVASREVGICNQVDFVCCRPKRSFQFFDPTRSKFRKLKKLPELDTNLSPFGLHRLRFASSRKVEIHWSMRAITMMNLRFVSGSGDRDRCEFREWLCCSGCIDFGELRWTPTRFGELDLCSF